MGQFSDQRALKTLALLAFPIVAHLVAPSHLAATGLDHREADLDRQQYRREPRFVIRMMFGVTSG